MDVSYGSESNFNVTNNNSMTDDDLFGNCSSGDANGNGSGSDSLDANLCRDFQRGSCNRANCRYRHEKKIIFCHEFQKNGCTRFECRFLHASIEEEREFRETGILSNKLKHELNMHNRPPVCKRFLKDACGLQRCKYRHLTREQYVFEIQNDQLSRSRQPQWCDEQKVVSNKRLISSPFDDSDCYPYDFKRRKNSDFMQEYFTEKNNRNSEIISQLNARILVLEDENRLNQKQLLELRKKNSELLATNEFLLDQNAQLRMLTKNSGSTIPDVPSAQNQIVRTITSVPVSLTAVSTGNQMSIANVSIAQPVTAVSLAGQTGQGIIVHSQQLLAQSSTQGTSQAQLTLAPQNINTLAVPQPQTAMPLAAPQSIVTYPMIGPNVMTTSMPPPPR